MEIDTIATLITGTGFPIAMCVVLMWYIKERDVRLDQSVQEMKNIVSECRQMMTDFYSYVSGGGEK